MKITLFMALLLLFTGCGTSPVTEDSSPSLTENPQAYEHINKWYTPDINTSWQWQLQGKVNTTYDVDLYDIDLFDTNKSQIQALHDADKKVICYFSAGTYENWRVDKDKFSTDMIGKPLDGWEGERWLDIRNNNLYTIITDRLDLAKSKGCDGIEPDNVDGYANNTGFDLTQQDQSNYNIFLAKEAHKRGLSIGLKNDLEQIMSLEPFFDFAVNEQCYQYQECGTLKPFIKSGKPVFHVEYQDLYKNNTNHERENMCKQTNILQFQTLILPIFLDDSFRYSCQ